VSVVLDCSAAVSWCFEDEATAAGEALLDRVGRNGALVPVLWPFEIANTLVMAERRGRLTGARVAAFVAAIEDLPITVDEEISSALHEVLALARGERLTVYDAAYLELAMRTGLPLATRDRALAAAAASSGVVLISA
jgi:predicted nucleic acid-binding protein